MLRTLRSAAVFFWRATRGYRLNPWRSPYLRWRMETYTGRPAESLRPKDFLALLAAEWRQIARFLRWTGSMGRLAGERAKSLPPEAS